MRILMRITFQYSKFRIIFEEFTTCVWDYNSLGYQPGCIIALFAKEDISYLYIKYLDNYHS